MSDVVIVSIINGLFGLIVVFLGGKLNRKVNKVQNDVSITRNQVQNSHLKNFRDDMDEKFSAVHHRFEDQDEKITDIHASMDEVKASGRTTANAVSRLCRDFSKHVEDSAEQLEVIHSSFDSINQRLAEA